MVSIDASRTVCVVGAGFAGLAAAERLMAAGCEVTVLEARDRVGGRVWSQRLPNGSIVERGAEFIESDQKTIVSTVERLGLRLQGAGTSYSYREPRGGIGTTAGAIDAAVRAVNAALAALPAGMTHRSVASFMQGIQMDPGAREFLLSRTQITCAHPVDDISIEELGHISFLPDEGLRIAGGNQTLAVTVAERLGPRVRLSCPVEAISWSTESVRLHAGGEIVEAAHGVVAVPASVMERITFDPPLPDWKRGAVGRVRYGQAAKLFVPLSDPAPPSSILSVPEHFWTWTARGADGQVQPIVSAFAGSRPALDRLGIAEGPERWLDRIRVVRPDLVLQPDGAVLSTWSDDPWVGGAYSIVTPERPVEDSGLLANPIGPLHFAGEHTAGDLHSTMNGALHSGLHAAREITEFE